MSNRVACCGLLSKFPVNPNPTTDAKVAAPMTRATNTFCAACYKAVLIPSNLDTGPAVRSSGRCVVRKTCVVVPWRSAVTVVSLRKRLPVTAVITVIAPMRVAAETNSPASEKVGSQLIPLCNWNVRANMGST